MLARPTRTLAVGCLSVEELKEFRTAAPPTGAAGYEHSRSAPRATGEFGRSSRARIRVVRPARVKGSYPATEHRSAHGPRRPSSFLLIVGAARFHAGRHAACAG